MNESRSMMRSLQRELHGREKEIVRMLGRFVRCESPSHNKAAVDRFGQMVASEWLRRGAKVRILRQTKRGNHVRAELWLGSGRPNIGQNLELTSLTAATLGGVSIFGGKGGVAGVLAAVLLLVTLQTALLQLNVNSIWQVGIVGILLIIVLLIDRLSTPRR